VNPAHGPAPMDTLMELSDMLVTDGDMNVLLHRMADRCLHLLDVQLAGILVADGRGSLRLLATSPPQARMTMLDAADAPGNWCLTTGQITADDDLDDPDPRWAVFARHAHGSGFRAVTALPMRVRGDTVGVLQLLRHRAGPFTGQQLRLAQTMANLATIGLLVPRDGEHRNLLAVRAQRILTDRIAIERARGILAELFGVDVDTALDELDRHARRTRHDLSTAAAEIIASVPLTGRGDGLLAHRITAETLGIVRGLVRQRMTAAGLTGAVADRFLLAIHEAAANAEEHGGGGRLWLWRHHGDLWCEVSDDGPGLPAGYTIRTESPGPDSLDRTGLWLIRHVCPDLELTTGEQGTRLLLRQPLPDQSTGSPGD
jgi:anti-sigma regulatory factor (Ser/Thr protein kinase)